MQETHIKKTTLFLLVSIVLVAANLRAPLTSVGSLVGLITTDFELSAVQAGMITTIPLLCFALISPLAPKLAHKIGMETSILGSLITLMLGIILRSFGSMFWLVFGTLLIGGGIAICNVLMPALIKKDYHQKSGVVIGMYSVSMNLSGAIASGVSFPLASQYGLGWEKALQIWAILTFIACVGWLPQVKKTKNTSTKNEQTSGKSAIWTYKIAWFVTIFMGLQSLIFYVLVAWLPQILVHNGIQETRAGFLLSIVQITMLPITFVVPIIAEKQTDQKKLVLITSLFIFLGIALLMTGHPIVIVVAMVFFGMGCGSAFSLAMMFFSLRTSSVRMASKLSGMAQSIGYVLAAIGPLLFGVLFDVTKSWTISMYVLLGIVIILCFAGLGASKNIKI